METLHSNTLLSSTSPAEKPSTGLLQRSESHKQPNIRETKPDRKTKKKEVRKSIKIKPLSCFWRRRHAWVVEAIAEEREHSPQIGGRETRLGCRMLSERRETEKGWRVRWVAPFVADCGSHLDSRWQHRDPRVWILYPLPQDWPDPKHHTQTKKTKKKEKIIIGWRGGFGAGRLGESSEGPVGTCDDGGQERLYRQSPCMNMREGDGPTNMDAIDCLLRLDEALVTPASTLGRGRPFKSAAILNFSTHTFKYFPIFTTNFQIFEKS